MIPDDKDTTNVLICALRYCVGRMTYMPELVTEWFKRHWFEFSDLQRMEFISDVRREIQLADTRGPSHLGTECDQKMWRDFLKWMEEQR